MPTPPKVAATIEHTVTAPPPEPDPATVRRPLEEWKVLKGTRDARGNVTPHWLHDAARVHKGWAEIGQMLSEAEYDQAIEEAGGVQLK